MLAFLYSVRVFPPFFIYFFKLRKRFREGKKKKGICQIPIKKIELTVDGGMISHCIMYSFWFRCSFLLFFFLFVGDEIRWNYTLLQKLDVHIRHGREKEGEYKLLKWNLRRWTLPTLTNIIMSAGSHMNRAATHRRRAPWLGILRFWHGQWDQQDNLPVFRIGSSLRSI